LEFWRNVGLKRGFGGIPVGCHTVLTGSEIDLEGAVGVAESGCFADLLGFNETIIALGVADGWDDGVVSFLDISFPTSRR